MNPKQNTLEHIWERQPASYRRDSKDSIPILLSTGETKYNQKIKKQSKSEVTIKATIRDVTKKSGHFNHHEK